MTGTYARSAETRWMILSHAARKFADSGYCAASLGQIAAAFGGRPGHIYYYFKSKSDIVRVLLLEESSRWEANLQERRVQGKAGLELLASLIALVSHSVQKDDPLTEALLRLLVDRGARDDDEVISQTFKNWQRIFRGLLDEAVGMRQIDDLPDLDSRAALLLGSLLGVYAIAEDVEVQVGRVGPLMTRTCRYLFESMGCKDAESIMQNALDQIELAAQELSSTA